MLFGFLNLLSPTVETVGYGELLLFFISKKKNLPDLQPR
jgi:hypothetical protein